MNLSSKNLQQLLKKKTTGTALSIYMPTHPASNSQTLSQDTTRIKNALKKIKNHTKYSEEELGSVMKSLYELAEDVDFWKNQDVGLAIFANKDGYDFFHLPYETTEATYMEDNFIISPLVIMNNLGTGFYVLDINLTKPRLLRSNHGTLAIVNKDNMPRSFQEAVARDEYKVEQQHMAAPRGSGGDNNFHGHDPSDALDHDTSRYLKLVASAVDEFLADHDEPLLLVGEQNRVVNLRAHLKYKNILPESVDGNFEAHTPQSLFDAIIKVIQNHEANTRDALVEELFSSDPKLVVTGAKAIAQAAQAGRVARIYVPAYRQTNDNMRPITMGLSIVLQLPPDEINGIESLIRDVLSQAGSVVAVEFDAYPKLTRTMALCRF